MHQLFAIAAAAACLGCLPFAAIAAEASHAPWTETGTFVSAPDGDTLKVRTHQHGVVTVRLAGVDAPEHGQGYWRAAKAHLVAMAMSSEVTIGCYKTDRYDREVCRVRTSAGDVGESLLAAGLAWHYKRYESEQTPEERARYVALEQRARERHIGLWQEPHPMAPDECRKAHRSHEKCH
jgi:endonuclease YncB( thermonuclease family)